MLLSTAVIDLERRLIEVRGQVAVLATIARSLPHVTTLLAADGMSLKKLRNPTRR
jgi:hypothetical protein